MLELNQSTMAIIFGIKSILASIIFYGLRISSPSISGLNFWAGASLSVGFAALLDGLYVEERPLLISLIFNICIVFGQFLFLLGTAEFVSRPFKKRRLLIFFSSISVLAATFTLVIPDNTFRVVSLTALFVGANFWMVWLLLKYQESHMRFAYTAAASIILLQAVAAITQAYFSIVEVKISLPIENRMMPWVIIIWLNAIFTIVIGSWILFLLVTIRLVGEFKAVAEREERERIARDLHDTVLQTFQAFVFKTSSMLAKSDSAQSDSLERSLSEAISAIQEGREKVIALRTSKNYAHSLQDNLRLLCEHEAKHYEQKFLLHCVGTVRKLKPEVQSELSAIGLEAIRNAFRHSNATHHEIVIEYASKALRMSIRDNGRGISECDRIKLGHWGLSGIKERARLINADVALHTAADTGTTWVIEVKAALAYSDTSSFQYSLFSRRLAID